jgi:hypothetical protein
MAYKFFHLPESYDWYVLKDISLILINSDACPRQQTRPCDAGSCCLGGSITCKNNNCHNRNHIKCETAQKERGVCACKDI